MSMKDSLGMAVVVRVGYRKGTKVLTFIAAWSIAEANLGHEIEDVLEYGKWWRQSRSTSFRELALFRQALPEFSTPREVLAQIMPANPLLFAWKKKPGAREQSVLSMQLGSVTL